MTPAQVKRWRKAARGAGYRVGLRDDDLDDAESEGYVKALELERDGKPVTATAIGNHVRDWARAGRRRPTAELTDSPVRDGGFGEVHVAAFLGRLSLRDRAIVQARMDNETLEDIAKAHGLTPQGIQKILEKVGKMVDF